MIHFSVVRSGTQPERDLRVAISQAIAYCRKRTGKGREQIAEEMAAILGRKFTKGMLRDFTRNATRRRKVRFPAAWVAAFCASTGTDEVARLILPERLKTLVGAGENALHARIALEHAIQELNKLTQTKPDVPPFTPCSRPEKAIGRAARSKSRQPRRGPKQ